MSEREQLIMENNVFENATESYEELKSKLTKVQTDYTTLYNLLEAYIVMEPKLPIATSHTVKVVYIKQLEKKVVKVCSLRSGYARITSEDERYIYITAPGKIFRVDKYTEDVLECTNPTIDEF